MYVHNCTMCTLKVKFCAINEISTECWTAKLVYKACRGVMSKSAKLTKQIFIFCEEEHLKQ